jgi:hypothetical protein
MGALVPADDLPSGLVPAEDLPSKLVPADDLPDAEVETQRRMTSGLEASPSFYRIAGIPVAPTPMGALGLAKGLADTVVSPGRRNSATRGGLQGGTFGWGDEIAAAIGATVPPAAKVDTDRAQVEQALAGAKTWGDRYNVLRDFYRARNAQAKTENPGTYAAGEVAGALAIPGGATKAGAKVSLLLRLLKGGAVGAAQGAAMGSGLADEDKLRAGAAGAIIGAPLGVAGTAIGEGLSALSRRAGVGVQNAQQKAAEQAAEEKAQQIAQASGAYGTEVQKGSRLLENVLREAPNMTSAEQQQLANLLTNGDVDTLRRQVIQSTLTRLPDQAGAATKAKQVLDKVVRTAPQTEQERIAQLLQPSFGKDALDLAKMYGEPIVGGMTMGVPGATLFARTRARKALMLRLNRPGNQKALWDLLGGVAGRAGGVGGPLGAAGGAVAAGELASPLLRAAGLDSQTDPPRLLAAIRSLQEGQP